MRTNEKARLLRARALDGLLPHHARRAMLAEDKALASSPVAADDEHLRREAIILQNGISCEPKMTVSSTDCFPPVFLLLSTLLVSADSGFVGLGLPTLSEGHERDDNRHQQPQ